MGSNGSNRVIRPHSIYEQDNFRYLKYGQVESIQDENGMGRIKSTCQRCANCWWR